MMVQLQKRFILCLGNQKCGTSWLYKYLTEKNNFHGGFSKEYHIWDSIDIEILKHNKIKENCSNLNKINSYRYKMQTDPDFYFDYFDSLMKNEINLTGDITPSYSGLGIDRLKNIQKNFMKRGIKVKVIILIRDPLTRIKSAVRFNLDRKNYLEGIESGEINFTKALEQYYKSEHCRLRTNYHLIIDRAYQAFEKENIYIGFFENMFTESQIEKLSAYIGVHANLKFGKFKINKTKNKVTETIIDREIVSYYSKVYKYCFNNLPITKRLWNYSELI